MGQRRRPIVLPPPDPAPRRRRIPVEVWLIVLIIVGGIAGAMFAFMSLGYPTWV